MASIRVLLDTNVALDLFLEREPWFTQARPLWDARETGQLIACLSASALTDIFYITRKQVGVERARQVVEVCLQGFEILPVDLAILQTALTLQGNDFEDNVQIACALARGIDLIVTRDVQGFRHSSVPAIEPSSIAQQLLAGEAEKPASEKKAGEMWMQQIHLDNLTHAVRWVLEKIDSLQVSGTTWYRIDEDLPPLAVIQMAMRLMGDGQSLEVTSERRQAIVWQLHIANALPDELDRIHITLQQEVAKLQGSTTQGIPAILRVERREESNPPEVLVAIPVAPAI